MVAVAEFRLSGKTAIYKDQGSRRRMSSGDSPKISSPLKLRISTVFKDNVDNMDLDEQSAHDYYYDDIDQELGIFDKCRLEEASFDSVYNRQNSGEVAFPKSRRTILDESFDQECPLKLEDMHDSMSSSQLDAGLKITQVKDTGSERKFLCHPCRMNTSEKLSPSDDPPAMAYEHLQRNSIIDIGSGQSLMDSPMPSKIDIVAIKNELKTNASNPTSTAVQTYNQPILSSQLRATCTSPSASSHLKDSAQSPYSNSSRRSVQIGSSWSIGIKCLRQSTSTFECVGHLRHMCELLEEIDVQDRIRYCKRDMDNAIEVIKSGPHNATVMCPELLREVAAIMYHYFDLNPFNKLPEELIVDVFSFLGVDEFSNYPAVCSEWLFLSSHNSLWRDLYAHRFLRTNPEAELPFNLKKESMHYKDEYKRRLDDPELGDKVEVAWRGKFRLEAMDVYQGLAWWVAEVVDKHTAHGKYKIHYPGWESRWDEWVPRSRLRWAVERDTLAVISAGSVVELWCCGANVPGAWLESRVKKVRAGRYCIHRVITTGAAFHSRPVWVERDRLRLVRHPHDEENLLKKDGSAPNSGSASPASEGVGSPSRVQQVMSLFGRFLGSPRNINNNIGTNNSNNSAP